jgi:hypothetical protein
MIKTLRKIVLGTVAIAAVIALFATGPEVGQVWSQEHGFIEDLKIASQHHLDDQIHLEQAPPLELEPHPPPELEPHH